ncbi:hypothetical protein [Sulfuricurvum sp.]|uniref:hypothetical protein n=1 Tax=Sulfuricurvum sp. TaxID=2025608 RepID=UPI003BB1A70B
MMNNDNAITVETKLYGYIAQEAHSSRFSATINKLFKENGVNAMMIPMNIREDDVTFTISQMRSSKLNGAIIASEYQEEAFGLLDRASALANQSGYCDCIFIENQELIGDLIAPRALEKYAENNEFADEIAMRSMCQYLYEIILGENV